MKTINYKRKLIFAPLILVAFALFIFVTQLLWNSLMPEIFSLPEVGFWQAAGLLILGRLLLGGFHHKNYWHENHYSYEMRKKVRNMTPEERNEFFQSLHLNSEACFHKYSGPKTGDSGTTTE